jgi:hypothetical protein
MPARGRHRSGAGQKPYEIGAVLVVDVAARDQSGADRRIVAMRKAVRNLRELGASSRASNLWS